MQVPPEKQYEHLTSQLRYLNDKIIQSFTLFIKLATAIVGGVFLLHWKLPQWDPQRTSIISAAGGLFVLVSVSSILLILNNLWAWREYRKTLSKEYPDIPLTKGIRWWISEVIMCLLIAITCVGFLIFNPLK